MRKSDRQDACPTAQGGRDFMVGHPVCLFVRSLTRVVGQASSLSIRNDGQPRVQPRAERGVATKSFCLFAITFENRYRAEFTS
jgi:hypothetical protein